MTNRVYFLLLLFLIVCNNLVFSGGNSYKKVLNTHQSNYDSASIIVKPGWNLLSIPLYPLNNDKDTLFPTAVSDAYMYDHGYRASSFLEVGVGYWIKFAEEETVVIKGSSTTDAKINVSKGWNIIGFVDIPLSVDSLFKDPPSLLITPFYTYDSEVGYYEVNTLLPGKGYWVKAETTGILQYRCIVQQSRYTDPDSIEAADFALWLSGQNFPSDSLVSFLYNNLKMLRDRFDDSVRYQDSLSVLRARKFLSPWVISHISIKFDDSTAQQIRDSSYDAWNEFDCVLRPIRIFPPNVLGWGTLRFANYLHPRRMAELYATLPGVLYAGPSAYLFMEGRDYPIFPRLEGNDLSYVFTRGYHYNSGPWWYFKFIDGVPYYLGVHYPGEPYPEWWDDAMLNVDNFYTWDGNQNKK